MEIANELIDMLRELSPAVWAVLVRQVYVEAGGRLAGMLFFFVSALGFRRLYSWCLWKHAEYLEKLKNDKYHDSEWESVSRAMVFFIVVCVTIALALAVSSAKRFANPDFYAISYIIRQIKN